MIAFMELVIALLVIGALLVLAETILPGMVAGILGCICLLGGVIAGYVKFDVRTGNYILLGVVAAMIAGTVLWLKIFPKTRLARLFISENSVGNLGTDRPELLHQTGAAVSNLRPSGMAMINGHRVDVITEGAMIAAGTPIKVVAVEGLRVVVRPLPPEPLLPKTQT